MTVLEFPMNRAGMLFGGHLQHDGHYTIFPPKPSHNHIDANAMAPEFNSCAIAVIAFYILSIYSLDMIGTTDYTGISFYFSYFYMFAL